MVRWLLFWHSYNEICKIHEIYKKFKNFLKQHLVALKAPPVQSCTRPHPHQKVMIASLPHLFHFSLFILNLNFMVHWMLYVPSARIYSEESLFAIELMCKDDLLWNYKSTKNIHFGGVLKLHTKLDHLLKLHIFTHTLNCARIISFLLFLL